MKWTLDITAVAVIAVTCSGGRAELFPLRKLSGSSSLPQNICLCVVDSRCDSADLLKVSSQFEPSKLSLDDVLNDRIREQREQRETERLMENKNLHLSFEGSAYLTVRADAGPSSLLAAFRQPAWIFEACVLTVLSVFESSGF